MRKLYLDTIFFILVIFILGCVNVFNTNKPTLSEIEKRELNSLPVFSYEALFNGSYFKDLENYFGDTFILRDKLVKLNKDIRRIMSASNSGPYLVAASQTTLSQPREQKSRDQSSVYQVSASYPAVPAPEEGILPPDQDSPAFTGKEEQSEGSTEIPRKTGVSETASEAIITETSKRAMDENKNVGFWLIIDGKAVEVFRFSKDNLAYYSEVLNRYNSILGDKVNIYSMIAPTTGDFLPLRQYRNILESQNDAVDYLYSKLNEKVKAVNVYDALNRHKDEYIYFKTDHHWTALGAYHAYTAFMDSRGVKSIPLDKYNLVKVENFLGSAYAQTLDASLEKNPDRIDIYMPFTEHEYYMYSGSYGVKADIIDMGWAESKLDKYLIFLSSGGAVWSKISTNISNGKKILVMKDSFGNTLVPFLLPHYEEIYVIDSRFYNKGITGMNIIQFIQNKGINELMFVNCMGNVNSREFMENIEDLAK